MGMKEAAVWEFWVNTSGREVESVGVNVPVWLNPPRNDEGASQDDRERMVRPDYRVDAIATWNKTVAVIEVKETGNMTAIGQLMVYEMLFARTYYGFDEIRKVLVCLHAPEAIKWACEKLGIGLVECG